MTNDEMPDEIWVNQTRWWGIKNKRRQRDYSYCATKYVRADKAQPLPKRDRDKAKTIKAALQQPSVDVGSLIKELVDFLMLEHGFNNPNSNAQKLAMMSCSLWTDHLVSKGYLSAPAIPQEVVEQVVELLRRYRDDEICDTSIAEQALAALEPYRRGE